MTLTGIQLENFKCFRNLNLNLAPLTLLTGFNAAGKSSALQSLLLMAQTLREPFGSNALPLNGNLVRLGSAGDVINRSGGSSFIFQFFSSSGSSKWVCEYQYTGQGRSLQITKGKEQDEAISESLKGLTFLSALRTAGLETFPFPDSNSLVVGDVGPKGEFAPYWYVEQADEQVCEDRRHPLETRLTVRGQVDAWLNDLFEGASVNAEALSSVPAAKLSFRIGSSSGWRRPDNVGFGLSYAFPLIVALTCSPKGQTIIVDSPEAHLHPSAQSKLGQILAHFAASGLQLVVESHSDHLLSGIRLGVKKETLSVNDLAVHFFGGHASGAVSNEPISIHVEKNGSISNWPEGFFDQSLKDLVELS